MTPVSDGEADAVETPASIAATLATLLEGFESEVRRLQAKLGAARNALLQSRETTTAGILELRRLRSDAWLVTAAEEIADSTHPYDGQAIVAILQKHRDGKASGSNRMT